MTARRGDENDVDVEKIPSVFHLVIFRFPKKLETRGRCMETEVWRSSAYRLSTCFVRMNSRRLVKIYVLCRTGTNIILCLPLFTFFTNARDVTISQVQLREILDDLLRVFHALGSSRIYGRRHWAVRFSHVSFVRRQSLENISREESFPLEDYYNF